MISPLMESFSPTLNAPGCEPEESVVVNEGSSSSSSPETNPKNRRKPLSTSASRVRV